MREEEAQRLCDFGGYVSVICVKIKESLSQNGRVLRCFALLLINSRLICIAYWCL